MACKHKTMVDHTAKVYGTDDTYRYHDGKPAWTCSVCGRVGRWTESWGFFGNLECTKCGMACIDVVWCSDACKSKIKRVGANRAVVKRGNR